MNSKPSLLLKAPLLDVTDGHFRGRAVQLIEPFETYALVRLDGETVVMPTAILRPRRFWRRVLFLLLGIRPRFPRLYREPPESAVANALSGVCGAAINAKIDDEDEKRESPEPQIPADPPAAKPAMKAFAFPANPPTPLACELNLEMLAQLHRARRQTNAALTPSRN